MTPLEVTQPEVENKTEIAVKKIDRNPVRPSRLVIKRKIKDGMFGAPETAAVSVAGIMLAGVIFAYFFMLLPARDEFRKREAERSQKQAQLADLQNTAQLAGTNAAGTVDLMSSVDRFEASFLPLAINGNAALYQRLNELIRANGLRNTAGPQYSSLELIDASKAAKLQERRSTGKQPGIFPGTYVTVTVEGNYASLRHFISELESTRQYLVINSIEIEPNSNGGNSSTPTVPDAAGGGIPNVAAGFPNNPNNPNTPPAGMPNGFPNAQQMPPPGRPNPRLNNNPAATATLPSSSTADQTKRGTVSLQLEMAAYFRRPTTATVQN